MEPTTRSAVFVRGASRSERDERAARPSPRGSPLSWLSAGQRILLLGLSTLSRILRNRAGTPLPVGGKPYLRGRLDG